MAPPHPERARLGGGGHGGPCHRRDLPLAPVHRQGVGDLEHPVRHGAAHLQPTQSDPREKVRSISATVARRLSARSAGVL